MAIMIWLIEKLKNERNKNVKAGYMLKLKTKKPTLTNSYNKQKIEQNRIGWSSTYKIRKWNNKMIRLSLLIIIMEGFG